MLTTRKVPALRHVPLQLLELQLLRLLLLRLLLQLLRHLLRLLPLLLLLLHLLHQPLDPVRVAARLERHHRRGARLRDAALQEQQPVPIKSVRFHIASDSLVRNAERAFCAFWPPHGGHPAPQRNPGAKQARVARLVHEDVALLRTRRAHRRNTGLARAESTAHEPGHLGVRYRASTRGRTFPPFSNRSPRARRCTAKPRCGSSS